MCTAVVVGIVLTACAGGQGECTPDQCKEMMGEQAAPDAAPAAPRSELSDYEQSVVGPVLEDIRAGVRPFNDASVGICKGQGLECEHFLGTDVGELRPGEFMVRAELQVPAVGEDWSVNFATDCETTKVSGDSTTKTNSARDKDHSVSHRGAERGYRLSPLHKITSPGKYGAQKCTWTLTAPHPDGDKVYSGSWSVPGA